MGGNGAFIVNAYGSGGGGGLANSNQNVNSIGVVGGGGGAGGGGMYGNTSTNPAYPPCMKCQNCNQWITDYTTLPKYRASCIHCGYRNEGFAPYLDMNVDHPTRYKMRLLIDLYRQQGETKEVFLQHLGEAFDAESIISVMES